MSTRTEPTGVVLDCVVFLQAVANDKGSAARILDLLDEGLITIYVSRATLAEARYVLYRQDLRALIRTLNDKAVDALFERLDRSAVMIKRVPTRFRFLRDPKDEPYINLALASGAEYLISRDRDLLDLMVWDREEGREFQRRFRFLKIVTPKNFSAFLMIPNKIPDQGRDPSGILDDAQHNR